MITLNTRGELISQDFINAITDSTTPYVMRLMVDGSELDCSIIKATIAKGSVGGDSFVIGSVVGYCLQVSVKDLAVDVKGKVIECHVGLNGEFVRLGRFTVSEARKAGSQTGITAYSSVIAKSTEPFNYSQTSNTIENIAKAVWAQMGIRWADFLSMPSASLDIDLSLEIEALPLGLSCYQVLEVIATACGGFITNSDIRTSFRREESGGVIRDYYTVEDGMFIYAFNTDSTQNITLDRMVKLPEIEEEPFFIDSIMCYTTAYSEDADGEEVPANYFGTKRAYLGANSDLLADGNRNVFLVNTPTKDAVFQFDCPYMSKEIFTSNIWNLIGYEYTPADVNMTIGDPRLEGYDVISVTDIAGNTHNVPCHKVVHTYSNGGLTTQITAVKSTPQNRNVGTSLPISSKIEKVEQLAQSAYGIAGDTNQYFWFTSQGTDTGAHITEVPRADFLADPDNGGGNLLARSNGIALRDGLTELATFSDSLVELGKNSEEAEISFCDDSGRLRVDRYENDQTVYLYNTKKILTATDSAGVTIEAGDWDTYKAVLSLYASKDVTQAELFTNKSTFGLYDDTFFIEINNGSRLQHSGYLEWLADGYSREQAQIRVSGDGAIGEVWLGIGAGGTNHGVYSQFNGKWIVFADDSGNVFLNGVNYENQTAKKVLASPNGSTGKPTFRALVASDITDGTFADARIPAGILRKSELVGQTFSKASISINANNYISGQTLDVTKSGYTTIGLLGVWCTGTNVSFAMPYQTYLDGNTVRFNIRNFGTSAASLTFYARVLYKES